MNQSYSKELRADTSRIIIPVLTLAVLLVSLVYVVASSSFWDVSHFWVCVILGPLGGWIAWRVIKRDHYNLGIFIFFLVQYVILTVILYQEWEPGSAVPYLFGVMIVASAMLSRAENSFLAWGAATIITVLVVFFLADSSFGTLKLTAAPILVNLALAAIAFLSSVEWQYAVETVSDLHRNVQRRRDELYTIQEEIRFANAKLEFTNTQLDKAREEALEERDIRTRFMNHVSHELRTPLNSIVNFAHIVRLGGRGPVSEGQIDYLERIEKSGWHLLSVLNDLLDMAQIQAGEFNLHLEVCELHALCEEAMTTTRGLLLESQVDLVRDYPEEWPLVEVDKMRVKQSLINLLGNAVKYTEEGTITLRVEQVADELYLSVLDTGIGIPPEYHETIFREFKQVNESPARKRVGTGLGLPITRHLIERHGGRMFVTSEIGQGSCFTIVLPVYQEEKEAVPMVAGAGVAGADDAILAAEAAAAGVMFTAVNIPAPSASDPEPPSDAVAEPPPTKAWAKPDPDTMAEEPSVSPPPVLARRWGFAVMAIFLLVFIGWLLLTMFGGSGGDSPQVPAVAALDETPTLTNMETEPTTPGLALVTEEETSSAEPTNIAAAAEAVDPTAVPTETATAVPPTETATASPTATHTPSPTPSPTAVPTDTPVPPASNVATALLNSSLFRQADTNSEEVTFVNAGDEVTVVGRSANGNWLYVRTEGGDEGFVFSERLQWNGDSESVPVVNGNSSAPPPVTGPLALDLYLLTNAGRCEGETWWQTVYMRGQGGNGRYTYYWNGDQIATDVANSGVTIEVSFTGSVQSGVGEVVSGDVAVSKTLFIPPPDCN